MSFLVAYSDSESDDEESSLATATTSSTSDPKAIISTILLEVIERAVNRPIKPELDEYRDDGTDDEEEDSDSSEEDSDPELWKEKETTTSDQHRKHARSKIDDEIVLPPVEDLHISVPASECVEIGRVQSAVGDLVVVRAAPFTPAIDLDSVLFLDRGQRPLGKVFDVFGVVIEPCYCVRFNSAEEAEAAVVPGTPVFYAPASQHTSFVFVDQLRKLKGSDASWKRDLEPPEECLDYSDDEEERRAKGRGRKPNISSKDNPFYRRKRHYDPRDYGPIQWNSMHTPRATAPQQWPQHGQVGSSQFCPAFGASPQHGQVRPQRLPGPRFIGPLRSGEAPAQHLPGPNLSLFSYPPPPPPPPPPNYPR